MSIVFFLENILLKNYSINKGMTFYKSNPPKFKNMFSEVRCPEASSSLNIKSVLGRYFHLGLVPSVYVNFKGNCLACDDVLKMLKINFLFYPTMKFIISHLNFNDDSKKQKIYKLHLLKIIQSCLFMILIDHFLISIKANCAESSDFSTIEKEIKGLTLNDRVQAFNEMSDDLSLESQGRKGSANVDDNLKVDDKKALSTPENDEFLSENFSFETKIFTLQCNLYSMQNSTIPDVIKDLCKVKDLENKIFNLIEEIREKTNSYDEELIEKIEGRMKTRQSFNSKFNELIEDVRIGTKELILAFEKSKNQFFDIIKSQSKPALGVFNELDKEIKDLFKGMVVLKCTFFREKCKDTLILMILTKILELTPEEFKKDEQVLIAILSLN